MTPAPGAGDRPGQRRRIIVGLLICGLAGGLAPVGAAMAATTSTGTSRLSLTSGSLSIGTTTAETISAPVGGTGSGILPVANWSDTTGSGGGWNGTVAVSDFSYTGTWTQTRGNNTPLAAYTGSYSGTSDGAQYTVTVTSGTTGVTNYTWTSDDPTDNVGGSGTATNGTPQSVGNNGVYIEFGGATQYPVGATYTLDVGTQSPSALSLNPSAPGAGVTAQTGTLSPAPSLVGSGTTVTGGGTGASSYGTAVKFVSAPAGDGMGTFTIAPGASVSTDISSWLGTYTAGVQYSIVAGP
jgi:hypothetical protein